MPNIITLNGASVDAADPCALYQALYATKMRMIAGEQVEEMSIQSPVTRETVRFSPSNMKALDAELVRLGEACRIKNGGRRTGRRLPLRY